MAAARVLVLGLDPATVPGIDPEVVSEGVEHGQERFAEAGISADLGLVRLGDGAEQDEVIELLRAAPYECVVIGGGIWRAEDRLPFFESVIDLVRRHAPQAAIAFNSSPSDSVDAARRWLRP